MALEVMETLFRGNAKIRVIGVGGGGCNAVERMISDNVAGIDFIEVNTDAHVLDGAKAPILLPIGEKLTKGLGAGGDPSIGKAAAEESSDDIRDAINGANMLFVTAGMGGGTGTGAAPIIAGIAKDMGILTIGVVTTPFNFELRRRMNTALKGIEELKQYVDTLLIIPNQKLLEICPPDMLFEDSFKKADEILSHGVQAISNIIVKKGIINVDFNDIKTIMSNKGVAHMGIGRASGKNRAEQAALEAINSQLLETTINGAKSILLSLEGDRKFNIHEAELPAETIAPLVDPNANLIYGAIINDDLQDEFIVTLIATEFESAAGDEPEEPAPSRVHTRTYGSAAPRTTSPYKPEPAAKIPEPAPSRTVVPVGPAADEEVHIDLPTWLTQKSPADRHR